ncbi:MAG TPA: DNA repair protein RecN [Ignavibacteriaceae bacterium]|jgi:DNA repair protein RecN (Recombination protein N)|nr:MAG: DNA repair protein RecN [Ignavibacteria bacterium ADurb.Bin266]OQY74165.1 MAG: DNA repair protein RecN [Ignavibacteriales bacterium UTCHB2]HQF41345.1 DNA repair protein RecN [Ignavibacteriaceae bacterium]HQI39869.1 DNA repair protein RecN [Ignavibacteriaceae bacterium]
MLKSLEIKDYALIDHTEIDFGKGLNIITGETGAGKSILIDAMSLLLGERASVEVVRKGAQKAFVEGIFDVEMNKKVKTLLDENDIEYQPDLIIRREISLKGSNRCFINDSPAALTLIKQLGDLLVDLHGQHEHQSLLRVESHIDFLDEFAGNSKLIEDYQVLYKELNKKIYELKDLRSKEESIKEKKEIYAFQIKEIDSVSPSIGEDEAIVNELNILENSEKLLELTEEVYTKLYDGDPSVIDLLGETKHKLNQLSVIDKSFLESEGECDSALTIIKELANSLRAYKSKIDVDPKEVEYKRERLGSINMLKKKYGGSIEKIIALREKIGKESELAENFSDAINKIQDEIKKLRTDAGEAANKISVSRQKSALKVESEVVKTLKLLGISDASFKVKINKIEPDKEKEDFLFYQNKKYLYSETGIDEVEFYISTNAGEDVKPLAKVASGGEVSRIMLSLKTILAKSDKLPVLIFDEIDTGVSGRIAQKVGTALRDLASFHQIIAITHLPQIAGMADYHYSVEKKQIDDRTVSSIRRLNENERINEVAKLVSGEILTKESIESAKQLILNRQP